MRRRRYLGPKDKPPEHHLKSTEVQASKAIPLSVKQGTEGHDSVAETRQVPLDRTLVWSHPVPHTSGALVLALWLSRREDLHCFGAVGDCVYV